MQIKTEYIADDHIARLVIKMAKKFYSNPENIKKFEEWKKANEAKNQVK